MHFIALFLLLFGPPYWQTKDVEKWSDGELQEFFFRSPWAQDAQGSGFGGTQHVIVQLSSAKPMMLAELETFKRKRIGQGPLDEEFRTWLQENRDKYIVLSINLPVLALSDAKESKLMEKECQLLVGRKKHPLVKHFPPTTADPRLKLAFPRVITAKDKNFTFQLYIPGVSQPYREAEFALKDLNYQGTPEF